MDPASYLKMMNLTPEMFRENIRVNSEKQVRATLALEKIAELENVEISDEDIENEYKESSERFSMDLEKLKESVDEEKVIQELKARRAIKIVADSAVAEKPAAADGEKTEKPEKPPAKPRKSPAKSAAASSSEADGKAVEEKPKKTAAKKPKGDESE